MITIKTLKKEEALTMADQIVDFYAPRYRHPFTHDTVENTAIICLALDEEDNVVGSVRVVSDLSRHAIIVDLVVRKSFRRQKVGSRLLAAIIEELQKHEVKNIGLTTEPGVDWLVDFYKKNGFKPLQDSTYLELDS